MYRCAFLTMVDWLTLPAAGRPCRYCRFPVRGHDHVALQFSDGLARRAGGRRRCPAGERRLGLHILRRSCMVMGLLTSLMSRQGLQRRAASQCRLASGRIRSSSAPADRNFCSPLLMISCKNAWRGPESSSGRSRRIYGQHPQAVKRSSRNCPEAAMRRPAASCWWRR